LFFFYFFATIHFDGDCVHIYTNRLNQFHKKQQGDDPELLSPIQGHGTQAFELYIKYTKNDEI
jgi:hypothetical protein